jgi:O-antigen/teichoic acid export membrane protein
MMIPPVRSAVAPLLSRLYHRSSLAVMFNVVIAVGGVLVARLLGAITQVVLARLFGVAGNGLYTSIYTLLGPALILASLGLDTWLLRQSSNSAILDRMISYVLTLRFLVASVVLSGLAIMILLVGEEGFTLTMVAFGAATLLVEMLLTTGAVALRAQMRNWQAAFLQVMAAGLLIGAVGFIPRGILSVTTVVELRFLVGLLGLGVLIWLLRHSLRPVWQFGQLLSVLRETRIFFISDILANIALKADLTIVTVLIGSLAAGIYGPALLIINTTFIVPMTAWQVLLPTLVRAFQAGRRGRTILWLAIAGSIAYGLLWVGVLSWGADWLISRLYGPAFRDVAPLLRIMSLIPLLKSLNFCWAMLMVARDGQPLRTKLQAIGAVTNLLANLACIPLFGLIGAASVNLATEFILFVSYGYGAWRVTRKVGL